MLHVLITGIEIILYPQFMLVVIVHAGLVENAQHLVQSVVDLPMQSWYLHDDTVMCQAVHERIGKSLGHRIAVVVV